MLPPLTDPQAMYVLHFPYYSFTNKLMRVNNIVLGLLLIILQDVGVTV